MSSVLFSRGINTQTGSRKKADDALREMDTLKKTVSEAALTTADHTLLIRTLQTQVSELEVKLGALNPKKEKKTPSES